MRVRILQVIAAVITIVILVAFRDALKWWLDQMSEDFISGLFFGVFGMLAIFLGLMLWERRALARREQQRARDFIDL
ncbi:hypothetical protein [Mesorhizobium sp. L2C067A000]|uniref:hypothetical protein n=1 Tax=Mesorhizobium sp. L2C067A000 TaxID=1287106 RepID=UPI0018C9D2F2|nr:hypothetical protein [Mesorhizobium sp. L2C067A000]